MAGDKLAGLNCLYFDSQAEWAMFCSWWTSKVWLKNAKAVGPTARVVSTTVPERKVFPVHEHLLLSSKRILARWTDLLLGSLVAIRSSFRRQLRLSIS